MFVAKVGIIIFVFCYVGFEVKSVSLNWDISNSEYFTGFVYKNSDFINISPEIKLKTRKNLRVCNFILTSKDGAELPFLANLKVPDGGVGQIVVTGPINMGRYVFYIQAKVCGMNVFSSEMKVVVKTIEDEAPLWESLLYNAVVSDDARMGAEVVRVRAYEVGRSAGNSICDYKISAPIDAPFDIDGNGVIRSTNRLDARKHKNYVLRVTAIDCWVPVPRNSSISVNIEVKRVCKFGWSGVYEQINYQYSSGIKRFGSSLEFYYCDKSVDLCQDQEVTAHLILKNPNTKMCDRDSWSLRHQWRSCGLNNKSTELLPSADQFVREDHGSADALTGIYTFDGVKTRWEVPTNIISSDHFLGNNFTYSFWMRHEKLPEESKHKKEQILCNSDGNGKNRHHYSLFLHNCKIIFLYRTEPSMEDSASYLTPAEWRFKSPEICDRNWHHYTLIVETVTIKDDKFKTSSPKTYPIRQVQLFIDGATFPYDNDNPEIVDDMPMHAMSQVHFTKLAIGACWHARTSNYIQHFKGQLAGMTILRGKSESASVIECINQCHERLAFTGINKMAAGTSISINALMSSMAITASNVNDVAKIIEQMGYINSRWNPLPGRRIVEFSTTIKCSNDLKFQVPTKLIQVVVLSKEDRVKQTVYIDEETHGKEYALRVTGNELIEIESQKLVTGGEGLGLPILPNVMITDVTNDGLGSLLLWGKPTAEGKIKQYRINGVSMIESCLLHVHPPLNKRIEYLAFTNSIIEDLSDQGIYLNVTNSSLGLVIEGGQSVSIYRFVLQRINYFNSQLDQFEDKLFKLVCSKNSAHSVSNELAIKLRLSENIKSALMMHKPNTDHVIHRDVPLDQIDLKGQSEIAGFPIRSLTNKDVTVHLPHVAIILSLCGVILIIITVLALLRVLRYRHQKITDPFSRSTAGPWVRLKPSGLKLPFSKSSSLRSVRHGPAVTPNGEMEWDNSEIYSSSQLDDSLQITVNPLLEHENSVQMSSLTNSLSAYTAPLDHDERSLDGLPDEYDGRSEDFRDADDMTIEDDGNSISDDIDNVQFYQNGRSFSQNAIYGNSRDWLGPVNIHQNPRYSIRETSSK